MNDPLRTIIVNLLETHPTKKIPVRSLLDAARRELPGVHDDFQMERRLLALLEKLAWEGALKLPSRKGKKWKRLGALPEQVTAIRLKEDSDKEARRQEIHALRNETAWEPTRMAAFAHTLRTLPELRIAVSVNAYLKIRKSGEASIPHRERSLRIFGEEKRLDNYARNGVFRGRITLEDLDCFYCPEPLPFQPLSMDPSETKGKPLLVVENSSTYWSASRANELRRRFAGIVYGQGFNVSNGERASGGLALIESRLQAKGIHYFGDLDPAGLAIPRVINRFRKDKALSPMKSGRPLYRALLEMGLTTKAIPAQEPHHDPRWASEWLGAEIAEQYLTHCGRLRWPQEGLTWVEIAATLPFPLPR